MDKPATLSQPTAPSTPNGIYARGVVVSQRAKAFQRKDGSGITVNIECELALQPGVITWSRFLDPKTELGLKLDGEKVLDFPKLKEFQAVTVRATRLRTNEHTGQMTITQGELIA
jgi:hypothetical protein